jgi:UDP-N-acetylglucosamine 2-epimerase (non-hydrolysing)
MKVMTVLGTRPEIIRLSRVIEKLDSLCDHIVVHTGQNYDPNLSDLFFQQLRVRKPDNYLGVVGETFGQQVGKMLGAVDEVLHVQRPDALLILGDTNSGLCTFLAKRMGIQVYHMEAGNRCYDDRVPEEVNRRIIDHSSDILMPYTERSRQNLLREGIAGERIFVTGNPINEVIRYYEPEINGSNILGELGLESQKYFLVTMHRAENVDIEERLRSLVKAIDQLQRQYEIPVIVSTHPRTRGSMHTHGLEINNNQIRFMQPFGFFDFITLERDAFCILSDSGTVQEECAIFGVPNVTIRDVTERPETIECGSNILSGAEFKMVLRCVQTVTKLKGQWKAPDGYLAENVSDIVARIVMGYHHFRN